MEVTIGKLQLNHLPPASEALYDRSIVAIGDVIDTSSQDIYLRGKGTQVVNEQLVATVSGYVERVNKLVSVRALRGRYQAMSGDVVIGRVTEISGKRWRVDLQSGQEAFLMLSAVTLPGSIQRRTTAEDELNMRALYAEGDLIAAEVQQLFNDGSVALQTRSAKYGRLQGGQLVTIPPNLVRRLKQHFTSVESEGVDTIIGMNGMIWVSPHVEGAPTRAVAPMEEERKDSFPSCSPQERERVCRAAAAVRALASVGSMVYPAAIADVCQLSREAGVTIPGMAGGEFLKRVVAGAGAGAAAGPR